LDHITVDGDEVLLRRRKREKSKEKKEIPAQRCRIGWICKRKLKKIMD